MVELILESMGGVSMVGGVSSGSVSVGRVAKKRYRTMQIGDDFHKYLTDIKKRHRFDSYETAIRFLINKGKGFDV